MILLLWYTIDKINALVRFGRPERTHQLHLEQTPQWKNCTELLLVVLIFNGTLIGNTPMLFSGKPNFESKDKKKAPRKNPLADKSFEELKKNKENAVKAKDIPTAIKYLDAMRFACADHEMLKEIILELADLYAEQKEWTKAYKVYKEFILLYPGAARCDYAHYKAVTCNYELTLSFDRDQTETEETLKLAQQFFTDHPQSEYARAVKDLVVQCKQKLLESDSNIFSFYLKSNRFKAAQRRLDTIKKEYIPDLPTQTPYVIELSIQLAQATNNSQALLRAQLELGQQFPDHEITKRLALDVPAIKTQLAQLEQKAFEPLELPKAESVKIVENKPISM